MVPRLLPKQTTEGLSREDLPATLAEAHRALDAFLWPEGIAIYQDKGRDPGEKVVFVVDSGRLMGYAFVRLEQDVEDLPSLKNRLTLLSQVPYLRSLLADYVQSQRVKMVRPDFFPTYEED